VEQEGARKGPAHLGSTTLFLIHGGTEDGTEAVHDASAAVLTGRSGLAKIRQTAPMAVEASSGRTPSRSVAHDTRLSATGSSFPCLTEMV